MRVSVHDDQNSYEKQGEKIINYCIDNTTMTKYMFCQFCQQLTLTVASFERDQFFNMPVLSMPIIANDQFCHWPLLSVVSIASGQHCQYPFYFCQWPVWSDLPVWPVLSVWKVFSVAIFANGQFLQCPFLPVLYFVDASSLVGSFKSLASCSSTHFLGVNFRLNNQYLNTG